MKPVYLYITPFFPGPDTWRGAYSLDFVRALTRLSDYDVRVVIPGRGPDYEMDGIPVIRLPEWRLPSMMFPLLFARRNGRALLRALRDRGIAPAHIAVCHANTPPTTVALTCMAGICASGIVKRSRSKTVKSARYPGARRPFSASANSFQAPASV